MPSLTALDLPASSTTADLANGSILFIGNATVLIQYAGFTILTDPTFIPMHGEVLIGYGMHTTRLTNPAVNIEDLPPLDLVLLSHFHGDHFDQVAERSLDKSLPIVTTPEAARELGKRGFRNTHALERWASAHISKGKYGVRVSAMPGRHGPAVVDLALPEVMGEMVEFLDEGQSVLLRIYITGDTLVFDDITEIPQRYPGIDLMLLHLGATRVMGVLLTMDAEQGVEMMRAVNPARAIPIHYDDYDVFTSPFSDFQKAVRDAGFEHRVHCMQRGDIYSFRVPESRRTPTTNGPGSSGVDGTGE